MPFFLEIEERLKVYKDFLDNPPKGSGFENSYERRAYRVALRRSLQDATKLLIIIKALWDVEK